MSVVLTAGKKYKCLVTKPDHLKENALLKLWEVLEKNLNIDFNCCGTMQCLREQEEGKLDFKLDEYFIFISLANEVTVINGDSYIGNYMGVVTHQDLEDYFDLDGIIINDDALFKYDIKIEG